MDKYKRDVEFGRLNDIGTFGQKIDSELDIVGNKIEEVLDVVRKVVNDDGTLKAVISAKSLTGEVSLGIGSATVWQPGQTYAANQMVFFQNAVYWCKTKHKSDTQFGTDSENWNCVIDFGPYLEQTARLANSAHIVRISENLGTLITLAEQTSKLIELSQHIDKLVELTRRLPDLDKLIDKDGNVVLKEIYNALPEIHKVNGIVEDVVKVSRIQVAVADLALIAPEVKKLSEDLEEVRTAAKAIGNLKIITNEMGKLRDA